MVAWLLSKGVDVNPIDRFKRTPLEVSMGTIDAWTQLTHGHAACLHGH